MEFNAKFQAIQSAHEVLTDTQQRAKYDADRIRSGLLHTYTTPVRPNMPPRSAGTNFAPPPPPRPPPPSATKTTFPPPPSGSHRYTRHPRPEPMNPGSDTEAARAKVNAFKAWDQMRHGTGQPPQGRAMPPRSPRTAAYQSNPPGSNGVPFEPPPKRSGWDQSQESPARYPATARSKPAFDPGNHRGDEPSAGYKSAFNVSRGDHPPSRSRTTYMPPHQAHGTSPTKPDPLRAFRSQTGMDDPLSGSARVSTPYATAGGERTYFSSTGLGRSASTRESKDHGQWYDSEPNNGDTLHHRATSATSSRQHHSASPNTRNSMPPAASFSSSSSSSSDESITSTTKKPNDPIRKPREPPRNQNPNPLDGHRRPSFKPSVQVEEVVDDDDMMPSRQAKHTPDVTSYATTSGYPEGFMSHRAKRNSERSQETSPPKTTSLSQDPLKRLQHPLQRPKSWHDESSSVNGNNNKENNPVPGISDEAQKPSMYDSSGSTQSPIIPSSSKKWSDQWPFMSPKKPRTSSAVPPYWAIPSSLAPRKQQEARDTPYDPFHSSKRTEDRTQNYADIASLNSFKIPVNDANKPFAGTPPLRSHSSDTINMNFSPTDWNGKFTGNADEYFVPPPSNRGNPPRGRTSPVRRQQPRQQAPGSSGPFPYTASVTAPTPSALNRSIPTNGAEHGNSSQEEWAKHLKPATWDYLPPPPPGSPNRTSRKRPIAARKPSKTANKRAAAPKAASISATLDDSGDENEAASSTSLSSKTSGRGSAMDIDPVLTPPSAEQPKANGVETTAPAAQSDTTLPPPGPTLPPRSNGNSHTEPDSSQLNLGDLKNVAPFAPSQSGLGDLKDLSTTLPFESRPSPNPFNIHTPQPLILPSPPKSISVPPNLTQTAWERYLAQMRGYMFEWNAYNTKMLRHFNERQSSLDTMKPDWMSAVGEGNDKWGYKKYMQGVEEDFRVREHWDVSWERHRECMKGLGVMRERVLGSTTVKA